MWWRKSAPRFGPPTRRGRGRGSNSTLIDNNDVKLHRQKVGAGARASSLRGPGAETQLVVVLLAVGLLTGTTRAARACAARAAGGGPGAAGTRPAAGSARAAATGCPGPAAARAAGTRAAGA